jgi:FMN-dependent NADH-azoreductase
MIAAKFAVLRSQLSTDEQRAVWSRATVLAQAFNDADLYVISVPMWNFSVPYRLKHYIDVVTLPGVNWMWSAAEGYRGLLENKRAVLIYSSAGDYALSGHSGEDFQKGLLRRWLRFVGIDSVSEINIAPTLRPPEQVAQTVEQAKARASQLAVRQSAWLENEGAHEQGKPD